MITPVFTENKTLKNRFMNTRGKKKVVNWAIITTSAVFVSGDTWTSALLFQTLHGGAQNSGWICDYLSRPGMWEISRSEGHHWVAGVLKRAASQTPDHLCRVASSLEVLWPGAELLTQPQHYMLVTQRGSSTDAVCVLVTCVVGTVMINSLLWWHKKNDSWMIRFSQLIFIFYLPICSHYFAISAFQSLLCSLLFLFFSPVWAVKHCEGNLLGRHRIL